MARKKVDSAVKERSEMAEIARLVPHPRNYREHPDDQIEHIIQSIRQHGIYRNVVLARGDVILAGHGVVKAADRMGMSEIPVVRLDVDPESPEALKVLTGDNEISHLGEVNDRLLTEILKEIKDLDVDGLSGTGFDDAMLANLVYVTRPEGEIQDKNTAAEWAGMPEYENGIIPFKISISFRNEADRQKFADTSGLRIDKRESKMWSTWWPFREREDLASVRFG